jgi:hypothetical protein
MTERFQVSEGSQSGHCCFKWTVLDMERPVDINSYHGHEAVCECFDKESADLIAKALNEL